MLTIRHTLIVFYLHFLITSGCTTENLNTQSHDSKINFWYGKSQVFGNEGNPQKWINILGQVSDPDGIYHVYFLLNGDDMGPVHIGPSALRLVSDGTFNLEIDRNKLKAGVNTIAVKVTDLLGNLTQEEMSFNLHEDVFAQKPDTIKWNKVKKIQDVVQVVDGHWELTENGLKTIEIGYDRAFVIGDTSWSDYEIKVKATLHGLNDSELFWGPPSNGSAIHFGMRWQGHSATMGEYYPRVGWNDFACLAHYKIHKDTTYLGLWMEAPDDRIIHKTPYKIDYDIPHWFKIKVKTDESGFTMYSFKVWKTENEEPQEWNMEALGLEGSNRKGSIIIVAHNVDITFGDIFIL